MCFGVTGVYLAGRPRSRRVGDAFDRARERLERGCSAARSRADHAAGQLRIPRLVPRLRRPSGRARCSPSLRHPANNRPRFRLSRRRRPRPIPRRARPARAGSRTRERAAKARPRRRAAGAGGAASAGVATRASRPPPRGERPRPPRRRRRSRALVRAPRIARPEHEIGGRHALGDPPHRSGSPLGARAGERLAALRGDADDEGAVAMRGRGRRLVVVLAVMGVCGCGLATSAAAPDPSPSPVIRPAVTTPATGGTRAARSFWIGTWTTGPFHERHRLRRWPLHRRGTRGTRVHGRLAGNEQSRRTSGSASTGRRPSSSRSLRTDRRTTTDGSTTRSD